MMFNNNGAKRGVASFMRFYWAVGIAVLLGIAGLAPGANAPTGRTALAAPPAHGGSVAAKPTPLVAAPPSFDPAKFGTLTTETLPMENGKRLVARVNGRPVTYDDFLVTSEMIGAELLAQYPGAREGVLAALSAPVMDALLLQELNREYAEKHKLSVHPAEAKKKSGQIIEKASAAEKLSLQRLTQDQIIGLAQDALVREKVEKFIGDEATSVPPTMDEITSVTALSVVEMTTSPEETLRARHIVIRATPDMSEFQINDAKAKAEEALEKIRGGMDFGAAARQYSQDRFTAYLKGDVGYFTRGSMFKEFEEAAFQLKPGEISGLIRTPVGFHIIQVTERYPDNQRVLVDKLRRFQAVEQWKQKALESAKVERYLGNS